MPCQQSVILKDLLYGVSYKCRGHKAILKALRLRIKKKKISDLILGLHSQKK